MLSQVVDGVLEGVGRECVIRVGRADVTARHRTSVVRPIGSSRVKHQSSGIAGVGTEVQLTVGEDLHFRQHVELVDGWQDGVDVGRPHVGVEADVGTIGVDATGVAVLVEVDIRAVLGLRLNHGSRDGERLSRTDLDRTGRVGVEPDEGSEGATSRDNRGHGVGERGDTAAVHGRAAGETTGCEERRGYANASDRVVENGTSRNIRGGDSCREGRIVGDSQRVCRHRVGWNERALCDRGGCCVANQKCTSRVGVESGGDVVGTRTREDGDQLVGER